MWPLKKSNDHKNLLNVWILVVTVFLWETKYCEKQDIMKHGIMVRDFMFFFLVIIWKKKKYKCSRFNALNYTFFFQFSYQNQSNHDFFLDTIELVFFNHSYKSNNEISFKNKYVRW